MKKYLIYIFSILIIAWSSTCNASTYYISPGGADAASGTTEASAWRTFVYAFSMMSAGDELVLLDGTYSEAAGTGYISYLGTNSAQPPSGTSLSAMTVVRAKNPGSVTVNGALFLGRSTRKDSYIKIQDIKFEAGTSGEHSLYNTSYCTIKNCGFHGTARDGDGIFGIGTNDGEWGNSYNLIEDCWIWGQNRLIASNYRSDYNVWRRVVVRGDGCNTTACTGSGNPNVGITIYDSKNVSFQNVIVIDRILGGGEPYSDFATAQHTSGAHLLGPNEWLGCISLKAPDDGTNFEADNANDYTTTVRNMVIWGAAGDGFNIGAAHRHITLENITSGATGTSNIRVAPEVTTGTVRDIVAYNAGHWGINSAITPSYSDVYGSVDEPYNQTTCSTGCKTTNPLSDGTPASLKYLLRIETGSALKGTGYGGGDYGANVLKRYGADGTRYGEAGYNTITTTDLWPWPNEDRMKTDMASASTRGFCATGQTLTKYIWEYLGNTIPAEIYATKTKK